MGQARIRFRHLGGGLWLAGPRESAPDGTLRRAKGIHPVATSTSVRSRPGSTLLYNIDAHSLYRFYDVRFQGATDKLYRDGVAIKTGLNGHRLTFARQAPTVNKNDWMFVVGGGALFKVNGVEAEDKYHVHHHPGEVSIWGIDGPDDGFAGVKDPRRETQIESFDADGFTAVGSVTKTTDSTNGQEPAGAVKALKVTVPVDSTIVCFKTFTALDLTKVVDPTTAAVVPSPDEDFITMWVMTDEPNNFDSLEIAFQVNSAAFDAATGAASDLYTFALTPGEIEVRTFGVAEFASESDVQTANTPAAPDAPPSENPLPMDTIRRQMSTHKFKGERLVWTRVRVAKADFTRSGKKQADGTYAFGWDKITGLRLTMKSTSTGATFVWCDDLRLAGSVGMQGAYKYRITFQNSLTEHRSNPNPTDVVVKEVDRQGVTLSALPITCTDPQVDTVEIWRTLGNGALYFRADTVPLGTATYRDEIADYIGLHGDAGTYLQPVVLDFDNARPYDDSVDAVVYQGRMFWLRDDGHIYYSPPGRPEALKGFINTNHPDEPVLKLVVWQGGLYAFTESHVLLILGTGEPFTYREFLGVPGTTLPFTVVATPLGIFYLAADGPRLFDGNDSSTSLARAVLPVFRGTDADGVNALQLVVAGFGRDELFGSDGVTTLAVHTDGRWRELGLPIRAIYTEPDTQQIIISSGARVLALESEETRADDGGVTMPFSVETQGTPPPPDNAEMLVTRIYIDAQTNGISITPTLVYDDRDVVLPPFVTTSRTPFVEYARCDRARLMGVRLDAQVRGRVEVFAVEADVTVGLAQ